MDFIYTIGAMAIIIVYKIIEVKPNMTKSSLENWLDLISLRNVLATFTKVDISCSPSSICYSNSFAFPYGQYSFT